MQSSGSQFAVYLSKNGYVIRKDGLSPEEMNKMKHELKGRPLVDDKYNTAGCISFPLYIETKNKLYLPKIYGIEKFGMPNKSLNSYEGKSWSENIEFKGELRQAQAAPVNKLLDVLQNGQSGGILSLPTGGGKTFCALKVVSELKRKTLIIVNKISLMKQWEQEIALFMPSAKVGCIQGQKNVDTHNKDIVVAMLQSLAKVNYPSSLLEEFGITIVDEIHNTSTKVFTTVLMKTCSRYTIGLSATPKRSDGCEYVFKWFIGDIIHQEAPNRNGLPPIINVIKVKSKDYKEISTVNRFNGQKQIQFTSMLSDLICMPKRNQLIVDLVIDLVAQENRRVLVLSDRREHLKSIKKLLDTGPLCTFTYGLFLGQMKISDLEKSKACQVILATYSAFGEGISEKDLDTLVLATPKKFIGHLKNTTKHESGKLEQIVGRIFRKEHVERPPMIIDIHDNFSIYKNQARQRMAFYKEHFKNVVVKMLTKDLDDEESSLQPLSQTSSSVPFKPQCEAEFGLRIGNECMIE